MTPDEERRYKEGGDWQDKAFVALPSGWMAQFKDAGDGSTFTVPIPGVLIQSNGEDTRAVAAEFMGFELIPMDCEDQLIKIFYEHRNRFRGQDGRQSSEKEKSVLPEN
jgi:hypothetical protein